MAPRRTLSTVELSAYLALVETTARVRHAVEQQLREAGDLSYVQFQLLAGLGDRPDGSSRMTDLADGVVYSRSGLTYQVGLLESRGLVARSPAPDDERSTVVTLTDAGRAVLAQVFPGHVEVVDELLLEPLDPDDVASLADVLGRVQAHLRTLPPRSARRRGRRSRAGGAASS